MMLAQRRRFLIGLDSLREHTYATYLYRIINIMGNVDAWICRRIYIHSGASGRTLTRHTTPNSPQSAFPQSYTKSGSMCDPAWIRVRQI